MPNVERSDLKERAVLWPMIGYDDNGQPVVGAPVEIKVRWMDKKREVVDRQGNTIAIDAAAATDRFIPMDSHMWHGLLEDWFGTGSGLSVQKDTELMSVKVYNGTPDVKGRRIRHEIGMMRLHNRNVP